METINLKDYVKTGEGSNGESYDSIHDSDIMVKLYKSSYDSNAVILEHEAAQKVYGLGVPSPEPGELVTCQGRIGIRFRRIHGKRSYSRAFADEPDRIPEFAREFASYCKRLHAIEVPIGMFPDNREVFLDLLGKVHDLTPEMTSFLKDFIENHIPQCHNALHGDLHFGNILTTLPKGAPMTDQHDVYFIDLGYFASGCPLMDLGMTYNVCNVSDESFLMHDLHITKAQAKLAWEHFCDEYFFGPEHLAEKWFGPGADVDTVNDGLKPYTAVKVLLVDYNLGYMPPYYLDFINNLIK